MSNTSKIIRAIIAGLMVLLSAFGLFYLIISLVDATKGGLNGLAVLVPIYLWHTFRFGNYYLSNCYDC